MNVKTTCGVKVNFGKIKNFAGYERDDESWYCVNKFPLKIDWRCSTGFNPVNFKSFKAMYEKNKPVTFLAYGELCNYFNYEFRNFQSNLYCIELKEKNFSTTIYGYVGKTTPLGQELFSVLKNGESHAMIIELVYFNNSSKNDGAVISSGKLGWRD